MARIITNLFEHVLRESLINVDIYVSPTGSTKTKIKALDYQPSTG